MRQFKRKPYQSVYQLPEHAMSVFNYAKLHGISQFGVYKRSWTNKIKIVDFQGFNFVISLKDAAKMIYLSDAPQPKTEKETKPVKEVVDKKAEQSYMEQRRALKSALQ